MRIGQADQPGVIAVLGMHRSGTSCLAGCLQEAGLFLGDVNENAPSNAKGNRENRAIMDLHEAVLRSSGGAWNSPPENVTWTDELQAQRNLVMATYPADKTWGFKDPRAVLVLDGWLEALPHLRCVGTFRHPLAVCQSLQQRGRETLDGRHTMSRQQCFRLWEIYNRRLLRYQRRLGFELVSFDWPAERYHHRLRQIAPDLGLCEPKQGFSFYEPSLRHHSRRSLAEVPESLVKIYLELKETAERERQSD